MVALSGNESAFDMPAQQQLRARHRGDLLFGPPTRRPPTASWPWRCATARTPREAGHAASQPPRTRPSRGRRALDAFLSAFLGALLSAGANHLRGNGRIDASVWQKGQPVASVHGAAPRCFAASRCILVGRTDASAFSLCSWACPLRCGTAHGCAFGARRKRRMLSRQVSRLDALLDETPPLAAAPAPLP